MRVLRNAAAVWRKRAQRITPVILCFLWVLVGCGKPHSRELTVDFEVQPSSDGRSVIWSLQFTRDQYHAMLDAMENGDKNRPAVRELITAGLQLHHLVRCDTHDNPPTKLDNGGIAFIGVCPDRPCGSPSLL